MPMPDIRRREDKSRWRFVPEVNLGAVIQAAIVLVGLIAWAATAATKGDQTRADVAQLRDVITTQLGDLRTELRQLPDQRARLEVLERWVQQHDAHDAAAARQADALAAQVGDLRDALANLSGRLGATLNRPIKK